MTSDNPSMPDPRFLPPSIPVPPPGGFKKPRDPEEEIMEVVANPSPAPIRLTVYERVSHQYANRSPFQVTSIYESPLETEEAPYSRPDAKIGEEWATIDSGWVGENQGTVIVQNISGKYLRQYPTPEEELELKKKVIEVGIQCGHEALGLVKPITRIPPGQNFRWIWIPGETYLLRSLSGKSEYNLNVFPR